MKSRAFSYYILSTLFLAILLFIYIFFDVTCQIMDFSGWIYFITSCLSHSALITTALFLVFFVPEYFLGARKVAQVLIIIAVCLVSVLCLINLQVFQLYRFHLNGIILNMVFGPGSNEIFNFSPWLYVKESFGFLIAIGICIGLWFLTRKIHFSRQSKIISICVLISCLLFANIMHVYGSFVQKSSIIASTRIIPYYFPLEANRKLVKMGFKQPTEAQIAREGTGGNEINYPLHPLKVKNAKKPNIIFILIDSWNKRTLTPETMPSVYQFAKENQWYDNHFSSSNGTRYAVFGLFFSIPSIYWNAMESGHVSPLFINQMLSEGYGIHIHASATLDNPPFARIVFQRVPHLQRHTPGTTPYDRDVCITKDLIKELPTLKHSGKPFFSMAFYDLAHAIALPASKQGKFKPAWTFADYSKLSNDMNPTPFFNLYRDCVNEIDQLIGQIFTALKKNGMDKNTIIIITGDHAQEFNENHKGYWGHNGNFSRWQVCTPLLVHVPGLKPHKYHYRTTHYDIVPSLMYHCLGVQNPPSDYSFGHYLWDRQPRTWEVTGGDLQYAFIIQGDTILNHEGDGSLNVTDSKLNPMPDYHINVKQFKKAMQHLNSFYKR